MILIQAFLHQVRDDPRIAPGHISIYVSLCLLWEQQQPADHLCFFSSEVKPLCKVNGKAAFHRMLRDLDAFGYIRYLPTFDRYHGSRVSLTNVKGSGIPAPKAKSSKNHQQLQLL